MLEKIEGEVFSLLPFDSIISELPSSSPGSSNELATDVPSTEETVDDWTWTGGGANSAKIVKDPAQQTDAEYLMTEVIRQGA